MRVSVTEWLAQPQAVLDGELHTSGSHSGRALGIHDLTAGTLVHRLFQFGLAPQSGSLEDETAHALTLLAPEERATLQDAEATAAAAVGAWRSMRTRDDVSALLASGNPAYEVPFSMLRPGVAASDGVVARGSEVLRGAIDCLIRTPDGSVIVVEFKSGTARAVHQRQLDLYIEAARALFPGANVSGRLIYPDNPRPDPLLIHPA